MHRTLSTALLLGLLIGCGTKAPAPKPDNSDGTPKPKPEPKPNPNPKPDPKPGPAPKPGPTPNPTPTPTPNPTPTPVKPIEATVLTPRGVLKTGRARGLGVNNPMFVSADNKRAVIGFIEARETQVWDITGEPKKLPVLPGAALALSPDGKLYLRRTADGVELASTENGEAVCGVPYANAKTGVSTPDFAFRNADTLVAARWGEFDLPKQPNRWVIREYSTKTGKETASFDFAREGPELRMGLNGGAEFAMGNARTNRVEVWSLATQKPVREFTLAGKSTGSWGNFDVSRDGKWASVERSIETEFFDGKSGERVAVLSRGAHAGVFVPNRDLYAAWFSNHCDPAGKPLKSYYIFDLKRKEVVAILPSDGFVRVFSPDGKVMLTDSSAGDISVWDLTQIP